MKTTETTAVLEINLLEHKPVLAVGAKLNGRTLETEAYPDGYEYVPDFVSIFVGEADNEIKLYPFSYTSLEVYSLKESDKGECTFFLAKNVDEWSRKLGASRFELVLEYARQMQDYLQKLWQKLKQ